MAKLQATAAVNATALLSLVKVLGGVTNVSVTGLKGGAPGADGFVIKSSTEQITVKGSGFAYLPIIKIPTGGTIASLDYTSGGKPQYSLTELTLAVGDVAKMVLNPLSIGSTLFKGDDTLYGSAFNDTLDAGGGFKNFVQGGKGNDTLEGGVSGTNTADYSDKTKSEGISVKLDPFHAVKVKVGASEVDTINHFQNINGGAGNDTINGDFRDNWLTGNGGNDKLYGGSGNDVLVGNDGDDMLKPGLSNVYSDTVVGGAGNDTIDFSDQSAAITLNLGLKNASYPIYSEAFANGVMTSWVRDVENIIGGKGKDVLTGDAGANRIAGGAEADTLKGAGGNDTFVFDTALGGKTNFDVILDFGNAKGNDDRFALDQEIFKTALPITDPKSPLKGYLQADEFKLIDIRKVATMLDRGDRILYDKAHGDLYFDQDGSGTKYGLVKFAEVADSTNLTAADFLIV